MNAVTARRVDTLLGDLDVEEIPEPVGETFEFLDRHWWHAAHGVGLELAHEWAEDDS
jgi:hypothetical protein